MLIRQVSLTRYLKQIASPRVSRILLVSLLLTNGFISLSTNLYVQLSDQVYAQDFIQDFLLMKAIIHGVNPYMPIRQLAELYLGGLPPTAYAFDHPTPHPASIGILLLPLGGLSYEAAAAVWFGVSVASLGGTVLLLARSSAIALSWWKLVVLLIVLIGWPPVRRELILGQPMPLIIFLVAAGRSAMVAGRPTLAGVSLAGALLVKPVTWLLVLALPLRRQFGALRAALIMLVVGAVATVAVVGVSPLVTYVRAVLPSVSDIYLASGLNISVSALAWRIFRGTESYAGDELFTRPLIHAEPIAVAASLIFQVCVVLLTIFMVSKARNDDQALLVSLCLSPMINPIAWGTYLCLAIIPLWYVFHSVIVHKNTPVLEMLLACITLLMLSTPMSVWVEMAIVVGGVTPIPGTPVELPIVASCLTFAPDIGLIMLAWLVLRCGLRPTLGNVGAPALLRRSA